jgi:hypothetical protein
VIITKPKPAKVTGLFDSSIIKPVVTNLTSINGRLVEPDDSHAYLPSGNSVKEAGVEEQHHSKGLRPN